MLTFKICKLAAEKSCAGGSGARVSEKKMIALHSQLPASTGKSARYENSISAQESGQFTSNKLYSTSDVE